MKKIEVQPYDPKWPQIYKIEADLIQSTLENQVEAIYHIGSTSVPGLSAKRDIDILLVVKNLEDSKALEKVGYVFKGELNIPLRYFFSKNTDRSKVNLHVVEKDHGFISLQLKFKDYLIQHEDLKNAYQNLKYEILKDPYNHQKHGSNCFSEYGSKKYHFIQNVLKKAGFEDLIPNFVAHEKERDFFKKLMEKDCDPKDYNFLLSKGTSMIAVAIVKKAEKNQVVIEKMRAIKGFEDSLDDLKKVIQKWSKLHHLDL